MLLGLKGTAVLSNARLIVCPTEEHRLPSPTVNPSEPKGSNSSCYSGLPICLRLFGLSEQADPLLCFRTQPICTNMAKAFALYLLTILGPVERDMEARSSPKYFSSYQELTKYTYVRGLNDYIAYVEAVL